MVAEFRAYGGIWKFLAASVHAREQGGDALTKLRMPHGKMLGNSTLECHQRVGVFSRRSAEWGPRTISWMRTRRCANSGCCKRAQG